jgi:hypothetical protein
MQCRRLPALLLALALTPGLSAGGPREWDLSYALTSRHQAFEVAYLPFFVEARPRYVFTNLRASLELVKLHDHGDAGVRLHVDGMAGEHGWYVMGGVFLVGGESVGAGVGIRLGGGVRLSDVVRVGLVTDLAAGSKGASGSLGVQVGFTF